MQRKPRNEIAPKQATPSPWHRTGVTLWIYLGEGTTALEERDRGKEVHRTKLRQIRRSRREFHPAPATLPEGMEGLANRWESKPGPRQPCEAARPARPTRYAHRADPALYESHHASNGCFDAIHVKSIWNTAAADGARWRSPSGAVTQGNKIPTEPKVARSI